GGPSGGSDQRRRLGVELVHHVPGDPPLEARHPSFRFNPGPPIPGTTIRPRPGLPLKVLFVCAVAAPLVFVGTVIAGATRTHGPTRRIEAISAAIRPRP